MKFLRLRVANYRGITAAEVAFAPDGITLIQGPNEAGKTSLAEAIGLLFYYADSSKRHDIEAIKPVNRDEGSEIELQARSGPYEFTYFKRFHKKPETRLVVTRPKPENHTGREAHDRADAILRETLDVDLWKALIIQQGDAIDQPDLTKQTSLSVALDMAAGGRPADPREEGLFDKVREEYSLYYTERGAEKKDLVESKKTLAEARAEVVRIEQAIRDLESDIEQAANLQRELRQLKNQEEILENEVAAHTTSLEEINALESALEKATLKLETVRVSEEMARRDKDTRQGLIDAVMKAVRTHKDIGESNVTSLSALNRIDDELDKARTALSEADRRRKDADALAVLRREDFDYYNNKLHLEQLLERKGRIDDSRNDAAKAEDVLARNKVNDHALRKIQSAEKDFLTASAQFETGAPSVVLCGLGECLLSIDGSETRLDKGEVRTISVADKSTLMIPGALSVEVAAGSSIEGLSKKLQDAREALEKACKAAGVDGPDEARTAFDARREALRQIENKAQVEKDNLRDLTYEELERKLLGLQQAVPDYLIKRVTEPSVCTDLGSAKMERLNAEAGLKEANSEWEAAREAVEAVQKIREGLNIKYQETRVEFDLIVKDLKYAQEALEKARNGVPDDALDVNLADSIRAVADEEANVVSAEALLKAKNPERVRVLAETAKDSLQTTQNRRGAAHTELTQVQTRLKIHGEEGWHEKLHVAQSRLERLEHENRALFRRAVAVRCLLDFMREERDKVRRAYVAPIKEKIERLGRLVFDDTFQVDISDELQIISRSANGATVPFDSLSGGTREQLSLIFRLACSMIVAKDGDGTPLILDDALGYTDAARLRLMGAVLARAAKECQIVIFTCVPDRYCNVGAATIVPIG